MKNFRQLCAAITLTFVLTLPTFAGIIELPGIVSPPPPTTTSATTAGGIETGVTSTTTTTADSQSAGAPSITETVLNLLRGVLSLF